MKLDLAEPEGAVRNESQAGPLGLGGREGVFLGGVAQLQLHLFDPSDITRNNPKH